MSSLADQTLALAGVFQSATLAQELARRGRADEFALTHSLRSLFELEPGSTRDVFGSPLGVLTGLRALLQNLGNARGSVNLELMRYVLALLKIQIRFRQTQRLVTYLGEQIQLLQPQLPDDVDQHLGDDLVQGLDRLYQETISTLAPRIIVQGERGNLSSPVIAGRVRAVLLAGLRAADLWHQLGGRRWRLLLSRSAYLDQAQAWIKVAQSKNESDS